ncbi:MAG: hypothetical protein HWN68_07550 [Desulfobacterales bacterium]|nr:hypothetical protein [Desulfobacterales bacterium]
MKPVLWFRVNRKSYGLRGIVWDSESMHADAAYAEAASAVKRLDLVKGAELLSCNGWRRLRNEAGR